VFGHDVVKRPSAGGGTLRAADFRRFAPSLRDKLLEYRPRVAWFHGKQAYHGYLRYGEDRPPGAIGASSRISRPAGYSSRPTPVLPTLLARSSISPSGTGASQPLPSIPQCARFSPPRRQRVADCDAGVAGRGRRPVRMRCLSSLLVREVLAHKICLKQPRAMRSDGAVRPHAATPQSWPRWHRSASGSAPNSLIARADGYWRRTV